jgi:hypothetical protein
METACLRGNFDAEIRGEIIQDGEIVQDNDRLEILRERRADKKISTPEGISKSGRGYPNG